MRSNEACRRWKEDQTRYTIDQDERSSLENKTSAKTGINLSPKMQPNRIHLLCVADNKPTVQIAGLQTSMTISQSHSKRETPDKRLIGNRSRVVARSTVLCQRGKKRTLHSLLAHGVGLGCRSGGWSILEPRNNPHPGLLVAGKQPELAISRTRQRGKRREIWESS